MKFVRDILTNEIIQSVTSSNLEKTTEFDSQVIIVPETREIIVNYEQSQIIEIFILVLIGIIGSIVGVLAKKRKLNIFQRQNWNSIQKEQVRYRQYGKCNICFTHTSHWKYNHFDGNKNNNDLDNCQGLCLDCFSVKIDKDNHTSIYQESN